LSRSLPPRYAYCSSRMSLRWPIELDRFSCQRFQVLALKAAPLFGMGTAAALGLSWINSLSFQIGSTYLL